MGKFHGPRDTRGVGPADRTGKSPTTCCPGGTRELDTLSRRRPLNPREMKLIDSPLGIVERGGPLTTALLLPALEGDDAEQRCSTRESEQRLGELAQEAARDREGADLGDRRVDDIPGPSVRAAPRLPWPDPPP